jgi:hypothetical protein
VEAAGVRRAVLVPLVAAALAGGLVLAYSALGGDDFRPTPVANPCAPRKTPPPGDLTQQVALSALDGAACEIGVTREELFLQASSRADLERFAERRGLDDGDVERAVRRGLVRAVEEAERRDQIDGIDAFLLHQVAERVPIDWVLDQLDQIQW